MTKTINLMEAVTQNVHDALAIINEHPNSHTEEEVYDVVALRAKSTVECVMLCADKQGSMISLPKKPGEAVSPFNTYPLKEVLQIKTSSKVRLSKSRGRWLGMVLFSVVTQDDIDNSPGKVN